jgi:hypothetical protein
MGPKFAAALTSSATIVAYDEYFASEWRKVVLGPYVTH